MFFSRKGKLKKEYDERLVQSIKMAKDDLNDEVNLDVLVQAKTAESLYFYLLKEARIRKVMIK